MGIPALPAQRPVSQAAEALFADLDSAAAALRLLGDQLGLDGSADRVSRHARDVLTGAVTLPGKSNALDAAWRTVDAEGGTYEPGDTEAAERARLIKIACDAIERLGGMDPAKRLRAAQSTQQSEAA